MPYEVKLPDIGEGVAEGEIVRWLVKAGEKVREDQPLVEVMTDKASVEIPSPRTGTIAALLAEEGQIVPVGTAIVAIDVEGAVAGSSPAAAHAARVAGSTATATPAAAVAPVGAPVQATPAVRQLAKQLGVELAAVAGSGPGGRITPDDVHRAATGAGPAGGGVPSAATPSGAEERVPLRGLRRKIAEHMRHSIETAAHFTFVAECDFTELAAHRAALRPRAEREGVKLTFLAYVVKALGEPLRAFPLLNSSLDDAAHEIVLKRSLNIGIATDTPEGLTVPVLHAADGMSLFAIAREIDRLAGAARAGTLKLPEIQGGTFTITSTGARGGVLATPILHHPQVAILGVHEVKKKPAVVNDQIVIRDLGNLSLSLDHRVVDGAVGADFLYALIARLEKPSAWLGEGDIA
jgi:pyruvate dehydrogenase E2 component (dihydrolipoamide acetyltransferase)